MFNFFKTKNPLGSLITKSVAFCFVAVFIFSAVNANIPAETAYAQAGTPGEYVLAQQNSNSGILPMIANTLQRVPNFFLTIAAQALLTISSFILWMGGEVFEVAVTYSIINIGNYTSGTGGILIVWRMIRDLANISFIFILLYAAIQMILGLGGVSIKKLITKIFIAALLINFSLFFTQIAIDASNSVAIAFYNQIVTTKCSPEAPEPVGNIGTAFMCKLGIGELFSDKVIKDLIGVNGDGLAGTMKIVTYGTVGSIFVLIAAFIFFASALMFVVRFLNFIKLLVLSPAAFASIGIPGIKYWDKWLQELFKNCMIAPAYMAATYAALILLEKLGGSQGSLLTAIVGNSNGTALANAGDLFLRFIITIGMMIGTLMVANHFGGIGAGAAIKQLKGVGGWAQGQIQGNLGRGLVRAAAIPNLDKKLFDNKFGKTTILGRGLRDATTGSLMKQKFGSKQSVGDVDKDLKKYREEYAKEKSEKIDKDIEKGMDARKDWVAIMQDPQSTNKMKIEAQRKVNEEHKKYYENLKIAQKNAEERKSYAEAKELADKIYIAGGADKTVMEDRLKNWEIQDNRGDKIEFDVNKAGSAEAGYLKKVIDETKKVKEDSLKAAKLAAAASTEKEDRQSLNFEKSKLGKSWKWLYGEDQRLAKDMVKKFREDAKKGQKGDAKKKLKELAKAVGIEEEDDEEEKGKGGGSDKGGEAKSEGNDKGKK